nr:DNA helicase, UvrD/REP type, P-loop containing nucleoside triphosphate hydrolase [Tanacetum cinerariifolium]
MKAGNCFYQAKCYERAVKEYEKAEALTKCLSSCSAGKLFGFANDDMKSMKKFVRSFPSKGEIQKFLVDKSCFDELILVEKEWGNFEKVAKVTHDAAVYYLSKNNFKRMMKFLRSFRSKGEMRRFLEEKRCLHELVLLEKEWGNLEEAARVARLEPDPVLKADLLHMSGLHKESSLKILWHVFLSSTIFHSTDEPFKQKEKLLRKAVSIAKSDSDVFYQFVCNEAKNLCERKTEELLKKGAEFIYSYKENAVAMGLERVKTAVLEVHLLSHYASIETMFEDGTLKDLEGVFSENIVSIEGLIYFWSYWKDLAWELINWSYTQHQGVKSSTNMYEDFLFNYFGVRKFDGDKNDSYVVLNAEAHWVLVNFRLWLYDIGVQKYYVSEKVLKKLHSLHAYSTVKNFSMHQQTKILTSLFEVTKFLQKCKLPYNWSRASSLSDQFTKMCVDHLFGNVFHINWKNEQSKEMIFLRGKETFLNMLKEALNINRKSYCSGLTCGQMGRMAMIFLGSKIEVGGGSMTMCRQLASYTSWKDFLSCHFTYRLETMKNIHHSIASMISEMLNTQDELMEWLKRSKEMESSYPIMEDCLVDVVGISCKEIDDPPVMVSFTKDCPRSACKSAIFLNISKLEIGQKVVMEVLYPNDVDVVDNVNLGNCNYERLMTIVRECCLFLTHGLDWISAHNFLTCLQNFLHTLLVILKFLNQLHVLKKLYFLALLVILGDVVCGKWDRIRLDWFCVEAVTMGFRLEIVGFVDEVVVDVVEFVYGLTLLSLLPFPFIYFFLLVLTQMS